MSLARQVVFRPEAEDEVLEARAWYEARRAGLGKEFAQAIDEIVSRIVQHPLAYQGIHYTPVASIATLVMWQAVSQSAKRCSSVVKV